MSPEHLVEASHRLAYAERQHEHFRLRAVQAQLEATHAMAGGRLDDAISKLDVARNYIKHMADCNDAIDALRRDAPSSSASEPK